MEEVANKNPEESKLWESQLGFASLRNNITPANEENYINTRSVSLANILNKKGEYQISDTIFWIANDREEYIILNRDEKSLKKLQTSSNAQFDNKNIIKHDIIKIALPVNTKNARLIGGGNGAKQRVSPTFTSNRGINYRFVFEANQYSYYQYEVVSVMLKMDYYKKLHLEDIGRWLEKLQRKLFQIYAIHYVNQIPQVLVMKLTILHKDYINT
jgi:hypothetical protein